MDVPKSFGFAESDTVDQTRVVQRVTDDGITLIQQRFKQASVCIEAGTVENRVLGTEKLTDSLFQLLVQILRTTNKPHRGHAIAMGVQPCLRRLDDGRMIRKPQIVVGAEIQHQALRDPDVRALWTENTPLGFIQTLRADVGELSLQNVLQRRIGHNIRTVDKLTENHPDKKQPSTTA